MTWLRIVAGAFVALVVLFGIFIGIVSALESGKLYYGSYGATIREWASNLAGCMVIVAFFALVLAAFKYAVEGRLW